MIRLFTVLMDKQIILALRQPGMSPKRLHLIYGWSLSRISRAVQRKADRRVAPRPETVDRRKTHIELKNLVATKNA